MGVLVVMPKTVFYHGFHSRNYFFKLREGGCHPERDNSGRAWAPLPGILSSHCPPRRLRLGKAPAGQKVLYEQVGDQLFGSGLLKARLHGSLDPRGRDSYFCRAPAGSRKAGEPRGSSLVALLHAPGLISREMLLFAAFGAYHVGGYFPQFHHIERFCLVAGGAQVQRL